MNYKLNNKAMFFDEISSEFLNDKAKTIEYLRTIGLLKRIMYCKYCNMQLHEVSFKRHADGIAFICYKSNCNLKGKCISIRRNSFFDDFTLPLSSILKISYRWFCGDSIVNITRDFNTSKSSVLKLYSKLRQQTKRYYIENPIRLGGRGMICQIDESMFRYKQKYHVGRIPHGPRWVFGIVDTSTIPAKYFVSLVENRKSHTLLPIICNVCRPGSIIWSDEWRAYSQLTDYGYEHLTVNHSLNFVNPVNGANTQSVESLWNKLKLRLKKLMGLNVHSLGEHLFEWMWKDNIGVNKYENLINLLKF